MEYESIIDERNGKIKKIGFPAGQPIINTITQLQV